MGIKESLKGAYYALEDRYYAVLDRINKVIPIYKIIDPIDRHFPSFLLLILLLLFIPLIWFLLPLFMIEPVPDFYSTTILVKNHEDEAPLSGARVRLFIPSTEEELIEITDAEGKASFKISEERMEALLTITLEDYEEIRNRNIVLFADSAESFLLRGTGLWLAPSTEIYVVEDGAGSPRIEDRTITITFSCVEGTPPASINRSGSQQPFSVDKPVGCKGFSATASARDFKSETLSLDERETVIFRLERIQDEEKTGELEVVLFEHDNTPASNVSIRVYENSTALIVAQKTTDASGVAVFENLEPGFYDVGALAGDGRTASKENVRVRAEDTSYVTLILPEKIDPDDQKYRLFFKTVDSETQEPVQNADVFLYMEQYFLKEIRIADPSGTLNYLIDNSDKDKTFRAIITHPNYVTRSLMIPVRKRADADPTIVELTRRLDYDYNYAPVALFTANKYYGEAPLTVRFDASDSFHPDPKRSIESYEWDFGNENKGTGITTTHEFEEGVYFVTLRVKDDLGLAGEYTAMIQVMDGDYAPIAIFTAEPYHGKAPLTVSFDASQSFDPIGEIESYEWDFGDGNTATGMKVTHTFKEKGNYFVTLSVKSTSCKTSFSRRLIQVRDETIPKGLIAPIAILRADRYYGKPGLVVRFDGSESFDPDGHIVSYEWDFGDGSTATGKTSMHEFKEKGRYLVKLKVTDNNGLAGHASALIQVGVEEYRPVAIIFADHYFGRPPLTVTFTSAESFSPDSYIVKSEWDFGDGNTAYGQTVPHTFYDENLYQVTLRVTDEKGKEGETTALIQVIDAPAPSTGTIIARVVDLENNPVENARVSLHQEGISASFPPGELIYTDEDGYHTFKDLEPSFIPYYIHARKEALVGESPRKRLTAGAKITLTAVITEDYGEIKATVVDSDNKPVLGSTVTFHDSATDEILMDCTTNRAGECTSDAIMAGREVYVKASKEGYMSARSIDIQIIAKNLHEVDLKLQPVVKETGLELSFSELCRDWQCKEKAIEIISLEDKENQYYAKLFLKSFASESNNVEMYIRASLEEELSVPAEDYKIRILEVRSSGSSNYYSTCYSPGEPYTIPTDCEAVINDGAKMAKLKWNKISNNAGTLVPVMVKFGVEPGLSAGEKLDLRFAAKAVQAGSAVSVEEKLQRFEVGKTIPPDGEIGWQFKLFDSEGNLLEADLKPSEKTDLTRSSNYVIEYLLKNGTETDYSGAKLEFWDEKVENALEFPDFAGKTRPFSLYDSIPSLKPSQGLDGSVKIKAIEIAASTRVVFRLSKAGEVPEKGEVFLRFSVAHDVNDPEKQMFFEGLPESLAPGIPVEIEGFVKDSEGKGIKSADIEIFLNDKRLAGIATEPSGRFYFKDSSSMMPKAGDTVKVKASHPDYIDISETIPVRYREVIGISCVTVEPSTVTLNKGASGNFTVKTENCPEKVSVKIDSMLSISQKQFLMGKNDSRTVNFTASGPRVFQGIYPIYVSGKFDASPSHRRVGLVEAIVNDPKSCFSMDSYVYDMKSGTATGTITNKCLYPNNDPEIPIIKIANSAVELKFRERPAGLNFKWRIKSKATEHCPAPNEIQTIGIETTSSVDFSKGYVFELMSFDAGDFIEGNFVKEITGLKEKLSHENCKLCDVKFIPESDSSLVTIWIEGNKIMGRYIGEREELGKYSFTLKDRGLGVTQYSFISIDDYIKGD